MGKYIDPVELNLTNVFENKDFIVPIYQRSYAWEKTEIEQLITDIIDSKGRYFLGSLIVDKVDTNLYSVIDGQQRLTTVFLLLSFLKSSFVSSKSLKFEAREKSNRTLSEINNGAELVKDNSLYSDEILNGVEIVKHFFEGKEDLIKVVESRLSDILIIMTQVPKKIDLNHYFEIMNTRGEQLEIHEIAKGRLLSIIDEENDKNLAAAIWDACAQMDSYIQMDFDTESRELLFSSTWNDFLAKDFDELKEKIKISSLENEKKFSLHEILQHPEWGLREKDKKNLDPEENERFEPIISFPNLLLVVNEAIQNKGSDEDALLDDKKFLENLGDHFQSDKAAKDFIFTLLRMRYLFDKYILKREFAKDYKEDGKWSLQKIEMYWDENRKQKKPKYTLTYEDDVKSQTLRLLQSALRITYTSPKTMHWISQSLASLYENENIDLLSQLEKYASEMVVKAKYKTSKGFDIDRIVFTYLDYILERDGKSSIPNFQFQYRTSIEHFYPQKPAEKGGWEWGILNNFGNLALITVKSNSQFSNLDPDAKASTYPDTLKQSPKLTRMAKLMNEKGCWSEALVLQHEKEMIEVLEQELVRTTKL